MIEHDKQFAVDNELLAGRLLTPSTSSEKTGVLFLHGAGRATKERAQQLAARLAEQYHLPSFIFDFSGHGASSGTLDTSSLQKRITEAKAALACAGFQEPVTLCAFSMGGHVALELLSSVDVQALILFYPAVYATEAVQIPFGNPQFSATIRRERSWESSAVFAHLRSFRGNLLVVVGENDEVIPRDVIDRIMSNAVPARQTRLIVVDNGPHLLLPVIYAQETLFDDICRTIAAFATENE